MVLHFDFFTLVRETTRDGHCATELAIRDGTGFRKIRFSENVNLV